MNREKLNQLDKHISAMNEKETAAKTALQDFHARKEMFWAWFKVEMDLPPETTEIQLPHAIKLALEKWGTNDQSPKN